MFKSDYEKSYDEGWEDGKKYRKKEKLIIIPSSNSESKPKKKKRKKDESDISDDYYSSSDNEGCLALVFVAGAFIIVLYLIISSINTSNTEKLGNNGFYFSESYQLVKGSYYEIDWDNVEARPYAVIVNGIEFVTYNYIIDNGITRISEAYFEATIEKPWRLRIDKQINIRIGFTKKTNCNVINKTGQLNNGDINISGDLYQRLKIPNP